MRISSAYLHQQAVSGMGLMQMQIANTQQQLNTGMRLTKPSDDPSGIAALLMIRKGIDTNTQYQSNINAASIRLSLEENALTAVNSDINRAKELVLQGNTDTLDNGQRKALAQEARHILSSIMSLANTKDSAGDYLFSGSRSQTEPFVAQANGSVSYQGDEGVRKLQIGSSREVSVGDNGKEVFQAIRNGNGVFSITGNPANTGSTTISGGSVNGTTMTDDYTINFIQALPTDPVTYEVRDSSAALVTSGAYTAGANISFGGVAMSVKGVPANGDHIFVNRSRNQDIFTTLNNMITALETPVTTSADKAKLHNVLGGVISDLEQARAHVMQFVSSVGTRQSTIDSQRETNDTLILHGTLTASSVEDLDYAKAISDFNRQTVGLQAAQQTYVKLQGMSLFNYL